MTVRTVDLTIPELFNVLKKRLCAISSNCIRCALSVSTGGTLWGDRDSFSNSSGLDSQEVVLLQKEASDVLSLVQGLRNMTSSIGRLPADVLERILTMRSSEQDLLAASCVCRRWRTTLTSSPHLWTNFQCVDVARTLQYLERSAPVPINVTADFYSDVQAVIALKPATGRFGSLILRLRSFDLSHVFHQLGSPAPAIERLEVYSTSHQVEDGLTSHPSIPASFLGGYTPALKSLRLKGINSKLNFSGFPSLTRLTLITNPHLFDMSELFWVFASARQLEEVSVEFSGPTTPTPESQAIVRLPRMRIMSFSNTVGEFPKRLLSLLDMPSVGEVRLDIFLPGEDTRIMQDFLPPGLRNFPHLLTVDNLTLGVPHAHCNIQFSGPDGVVSVRALRRGSREQNDGFQSHWLDSLQPMSIAEVKDLTLCNYYPEKSLDKCPVFKLLTTINELPSLAVERCDNPTVIKALSPATERSILFPRLESLMFQLISESTTVFPDLVDMARARSKVGFPLNKVSSDHSAVFRRPDVDALRCYADCVQLNTGADFHSNDPSDVSSYNIATVRILSLSSTCSSLIPALKDTTSLPEKQGCHAPGCSSAGRSQCSNKGKNPLADLAVMYSRGWSSGETRSE